MLFYLHYKGIQLNRKKIKSLTTCYKHVNSLPNIPTICISSDASLLSMSSRLGAHSIIKKPLQKVTNSFLGGGARSLCESFMQHKMIDAKKISFLMHTFNYQYFQ